MSAISLPGMPVVAEFDRLRPVRIWLWAVAGFVFLMVMVGGATRLTGSGLSITEWNPVSGAIPPLGDSAWQQEFAKYQASPQYRILNTGMTLAEFKFIFWWEWGHRQLGRFIGLFYLAGLVFSVATRRVSGASGTVLFLMGLLLGLQGAVGWIMVASGLKPGMIAVEPIKLALHLTLASIFFASVVWMAVRLSPPKPQWLPASVKAQGVALLVLILLQIALGGLMAGSRSGLTYNTWPLMDGELVPGAGILFSIRPWFENFVDNPALVQFDHRMVAYAASALALWHMLSLRGAASGSRAARRAGAIVGLILGQAILGIATLLLIVPLWAALAHQAFAIVVLGMVVTHAAAVRRDARAT